MCELLGSADLPEPFRVVTGSPESHPLISRAMTPRLSRLLQEIVHADVKGAARRLWHEAKTLELIALVADDLQEVNQASRHHLSISDIERIERARLCLIQYLAAPPTLEQLARAAGFSETKLKAGCRSLFGASIFGYLRQVRMCEARRLLVVRRLNVTEVAAEVGYANPSKFAAAFRREFGISPSAV